MFSCEFDKAWIKVFGFILFCFCSLSILCCSYLFSVCKFVIISFLLMFSCVDCISVFNCVISLSSVFSFVLSVYMSPSFVLSPYSYFCTCFFIFYYFFRDMYLLRIRTFRDVPM